MPAGRFIDWWLTLVLLFIIQGRIHGWAKNDLSAVTLPGWRHSEYITQCSFRSDENLCDWTKSQHRTDDGFTNMLISGPLNRTQACLEFWYLNSAATNVSGLRALLYSSNGTQVIWTSPAVALEVWRLAHVPITIVEPGTKVVLEADLAESYFNQITFDQIGIRSGVCGHQCESNTEFWTDLSTRCLCSVGRLYCFPSKCPEGEIFGTDRRSLNRFSNSGICTVHRGERCSTFDGEFFHFTQPCTYTLVKSCSHEESMFRVEVVGVAHETTSVTSVQQVIVYMGSDRISLLRSKTQQAVINGVSRKLPLSLEGGATMIMCNPAALEVRTSFGLSVTYDMAGSVHISLPSTFSNKVCGLCGNFNNLREDDIIHGPEVSVDLPGRFPNRNVPSVCKSEPVPNQCDLPAEVLYASVVNCGGILSKTGPFAACLPILAVESYFRGCLGEMCTSHGDPSVVCETFQAYADVCLEAGITVLPWRNSTFCPPHCGPNQHWEACAEEFADVCSNADIPTSFGHCEGRCECDSGFKLSGGACVAAGDCGCWFNAKHYKKGETFIEGDCVRQCQCTGDDNVRCTAMQCADSEVCKVKGGVKGCFPFQPVTCSVHGEPHYITFDGVGYDFQAGCSYILATTCGGGGECSVHFTVIGHNIRAPLQKHSQAKLDAVSLHVDDLFLTLNQSGALYVNMRPCTLPYFTTTTSGLLMVYRNGPYLRLHTSFGLRFIMDGQKSLFLQVDDRYKYEMCGLCGTFSENQDDDFMKAGDTNTSRLLDFALRWRWPDDACIVHPVSPRVCNYDEKIEASNHCNALLGDSCKSCHQSVNPKIYFNNCVHDYCATNGDQDSLCESLKSYATACHVHGVDLPDWWKGTPCVEEVHDTETTTQQLPQTVCNFDCSFDGTLCSWSRMSTGAFDWAWRIGSTLTLMTGPSADHTGDGHCLYIEASSLMHGDMARVISPQCAASGRLCLEFWYHMYGARNTELYVYLLQDRHITAIWSRGNEQGSVWNLAQVDFIATTTFEIIFEGKRSSADLSDVAIDDVSVHVGYCTGSGSVTVNPTITSVPTPSLPEDHVVTGSQTRTTFKAGATHDQTETSGPTTARTSIAEPTNQSQPQTKADEQTTASAEQAEVLTQKSTTRRQQHIPDTPFTLTQTEESSKAKLAPTELITDEPQTQATQQRTAKKTHTGFTAGDSPPPSIKNLTVSRNHSISIRSISLPLTPTFEQPLVTTSASTTYLQPSQEVKTQQPSQQTARTQLPGDLDSTVLTPHGTTHRASSSIPNEKPFSTKAQPFTSTFVKPSSTSKSPIPTQTTGTTPHTTVTVKPLTSFGLSTAEKSATFRPKLAVSTSFASTQLSTIELQSQAGEEKTTAKQPTDPKSPLQTTAAPLGTSNSVENEDEEKILPQISETSLKPQADTTFRQKSSTSTAPITVPPHQTNVRSETTISRSQTSVKSSTNILPERKSTSKPTIPIEPHKTTGHSHRPSSEIAQTVTPHSQTIQPKTPTLDQSSKPDSPRKPSVTDIQSKATTQYPTSTQQKQVSVKPRTSATNEGKHQPLTPTGPTEQTARDTSRTADEFGSESPSKTAQQIVTTARSLSPTTFSSKTSHGSETQSPHPTKDAQLNTTPEPQALSTISQKTIRHVSLNTVQPDASISTQVSGTERKRSTSTKPEPSKQTYPRLLTTTKSPSPVTGRSQDETSQQPDKPLTTLIPESKSNVALHTFNLSEPTRVQTVDPTRNGKQAYTPTYGTTPEQSPSISTKAHLQTIILTQVAHTSQTTSSAEPELATESPKAPQRSSPPPEAKQSSTLEPDPPNEPLHTQAPSQSTINSQSTDKQQATVTKPAPASYPKYATQPSSPTFGPQITKEPQSTSSVEPNTNEPDHTTNNVLFTEKKVMSTQAGHTLKTTVGPSQTIHTVFSTSSAKTTQTDSVNLQTQATSSSQQATTTWPQTSRGLVPSSVYQTSTLKLQSAITDQHTSSNLLTQAFGSQIPDEQHTPGSTTPSVTEDPDYESDILDKKGKRTRTTNKPKPATSFQGLLTSRNTAIPSPWISMKPPSQTQPTIARDSVATKDQPQPPTATSNEHTEHQTGVFFKTDVTQSFDTYVPNVQTTERTHIIQSTLSPVSSNPQLTKVKPSAKPTTAKAQSPTQPTPKTTTTNLLYTHHNQIPTRLTSNQPPPIITELHPKLTTAASPEHPTESPSPLQTTIFVDDTNKTRRPKQPFESGTTVKATKTKPGPSSHPKYATSSQSVTEQQPSTAIPNHQTQATSMLVTTLTTVASPSAATLGNTNSELNVHRSTLFDPTARMTSLQRPRTRDSTTKQPPITDGTTRRANSLTPTEPSTQIMIPTSNQSAKEILATTVESEKTLLTDATTYSLHHQTESQHLVPASFPTTMIQQTKISAKPEEPKESTIKHKEKTTHQPQGGVSYQPHAPSTISPQPLRTATVKLQQPTSSVSDRTTEPPTLTKYQTTTNETQLTTKAPSHSTTTAQQPSITSQSTDERQTPKPHATTNPELLDRTSAKPATEGQTQHKKTTIAKTSSELATGKTYQPGFSLKPHPSNTTPLVTEQSPKSRPDNLSTKAPEFIHSLQTTDKPKSTTSESQTSARSSTSANIQVTRLQPSLSTTAETPSTDGKETLVDVSPSTLFQSTVNPKLPKYISTITGQQVKTTLDGQPTNTTLKSHTFVGQHLTSRESTHIPARSQPMTSPGPQAQPNTTPHSDVTYRPHLYSATIPTPASPKTADSPHSSRGELQPEPTFGPQITKEPQSTSSVEPNTNEPDHTTNNILFTEKKVMSTQAGHTLKTTVGPSHTIHTVFSTSSAKTTQTDSVNLQTQATSSSRQATTTWPQTSRGIVSSSVYQTSTLKLQSAITDQHTSSNLLTQTFGSQIPDEQHTPGSTTPSVTEDPDYESDILDKKRKRTRTTNKPKPATSFQGLLTSRNTAIPSPWISMKPPSQTQPTIARDSVATKDQPQPPTATSNEHTEHQTGVFFKTDVTQSFDTDVPNVQTTERTRIIQSTLSPVSSNPQLTTVKPPAKPTTAKAQSPTQPTPKKTTTNLLYTHHNQIPTRLTSNQPPPIITELHPKLTTAASLEHPTESPSPLQTTIFVDDTNKTRRPKQPFESGTTVKATITKPGPSSHPKYATSSQSVTEQQPSTAIPNHQTQATSMLVTTLTTVASPSAATLGNTNSELNVHRSTLFDPTARMTSLQRPRTRDSTTKQPPITDGTTRRANSLTPTEPSTQIMIPTSNQATKEILATTVESEKTLLTDATTYSLHHQTESQHLVPASFPTTMIQQTKISAEQEEPNESTIKHKEKTTHQPEGGVSYQPHAPSTISPQPLRTATVKLQQPTSSVSDRTTEPPTLTKYQTTTKPDIEFTVRPSDGGLKTTPGSQSQNLPRTQISDGPPKTTRHMFTASRQQFPTTTRKADSSNPPEPKTVTPLASTRSTIQTTVKPGGKEQLTTPHLTSEGSTEVSIMTRPRPESDITPRTVKPLMTDIPQTTTLAAHSPLKTTLRPSILQTTSGSRSETQLAFKTKHPTTSRPQSKTTDKHASVSTKESQTRSRFSTKHQPPLQTKPPHHSTPGSLPSTSEEETHRTTAPTTQQQPTSGSSLGTDPITASPHSSRTTGGNSTVQEATATTTEQQTSNKICPMNSHYSTCMPACVPTCSQLNGPLLCRNRTGCVAGCVCNDGFVLKRNICLPVQRCGCVDRNGNKYKFQERWLSDHCTQKCECRKRLGRGRISCDETECQGNSICLLRGNKYHCKKTGFEECTVFKGAFYKTFDRMRNYFKGEHSYVLVQTRDLPADIPNVYIEGVNYDIDPDDEDDYDGDYNDFDISIRYRAKYGKRKRPRVDDDSERSESRHEKQKEKRLHDDSDESSSHEVKSKDSQSKEKDLHDDTSKRSNDGSKSKDSKKDDSDQRNSGDSNAEDSREDEKHQQIEDDSDRSVSDENKSREREKKEKQLQERNNSDRRSRDESKSKDSKNREKNLHDDTSKRSNDGSKSKDSKKDDSEERNSGESNAEDSREDEKHQQIEDDSDRSRSDKKKSREREKKKKQLQERNNSDKRSRDESKSKDSKSKEKNDDTSKRSNDGSKSKDSKKDDSEERNSGKSKSEDSKEDEKHLQVEDDSDRSVSDESKSREREKEDKHLQQPNDSHKSSRGDELQSQDSKKDDSDERNRGESKSKDSKKDEKHQQVEDDSERSSSDENKSIEREKKEVQEPNDSGRRSRDEDSKKDDSGERNSGESKSEGRREDEKHQQVDDDSDRNASDDSKSKEREKKEKHLQEPDDSDKSSHDVDNPNDSEMDDKHIIEHDDSDRSSGEESKSEDRKKVDSDRNGSDESKSREREKKEVQEPNDSSRRSRDGSKSKDSKKDESGERNSGESKSEGRREDEKNQKGDDDSDRSASDDRKSREREKKEKHLQEPDDSDKSSRDVDNPKDSEKDDSGERNSGESKSEDSREDEKHQQVDDDSARRTSDDSKYKEREKKEKQLEKPNDSNHQSSRDKDKSKDSEMDEKRLIEHDDSDRSSREESKSEDRKNVDSDRNGSDESKSRAREKKEKHLQEPDDSNKTGSDEVKSEDSDTDDKPLIVRDDSDRSRSDESKSRDSKKDEQHLQELDVSHKSSSDESKSEDSRMDVQHFKVQELKVRVYNHTVEFKRNLVLVVDGKVTRTPTSPSLGLHIRSHCAKFYLETDFGLSVEFNVHSTTEINLPSIYIGKVEGLCGNFDCRRWNDRKKPDGKIVKDVQEFGESWRANN